MRNLNSSELEQVYGGGSKSGSKKGGSKGGSRKGGSKGGSKKGGSKGGSCY